MSSNTDSKHDSKEEQDPPTASRPAEQEAVTTAPKDHQEASVKLEEESQGTYTGMAQSAAASATAAAAGVKDNVFSMFGGGAKKEKKEEPADDPSEPSGSSKAKRDAEATGADKDGEGAETHVCSQKGLGFLIADIVTTGRSSRFS